MPSRILRGLPNHVQAGRGLQAIWIMCGGPMSRCAATAETIAVRASSTSQPVPGHRVARELAGVACSSPRELPHQSQERAGSNPRTEDAHAKLLPLAAEAGHHEQYDPEQDEGTAKGADNDDVGIPHRNAAR